MVKNLKEINISDITPSDYNPRKISDKDFNKLKKSLKEFGLVDPIIINLKTNNIIGGHQRFDVFYKENPNKKLYLMELGDIGWVLEDTDLKIKDEAHEKALNLALNRMGGEFDIEKLNPLLDELEELQLGELTGFDLDLEEISYDIEVVYSDDDEEDYEDDYYEDDYEDDTEDRLTSSSQTTQKPKRNIQYGNIFKLKNNIILCGDSSDESYIEDLEKVEDKEVFLEYDGLELIKSKEQTVNYYITPNPKLIESLINDYGESNIVKLK